MPHIGQKEGRPGPTDPMPRQEDRTRSNRETQP